MFNEKSWKLKQSVVIIVGILCGCSSFEPPKPEQVVEQRALQYWKARVEGRLDKAYLFTSPSYRAAHNFDLYRARFGQGGGLKSAEPVRASCEPARCIVTLKMISNVAIPMANLPNLVSYYEETWLLEDGDWWRYEEL